MSTATPTAPAVLGRRMCAGLAVGSAILHASMVLHTGSVMVAALIIVMAAACLYCARDLWIGSTLRAWCVVALMNLGMVAVHWTVPGCHPGSVSTSPGAAPSALMTTATTVALIEAVIATAVLVYRTRGRASSLSGGRSEFA